MPKARGFLALLVAALVMLVLAACGDDSSTSSTEAASPADQCSDVDPAQPKEVKLPPPKQKAPTASGVVFETNCGSFTVALDGTPKTAANMQYLAEQGVYDGTPFQRVAPGFLIQGGDPLGNSTGDPGYHIVDQPPPSTAYTQGVVAMSRNDAEPPGTQGCQFFIITGADGGLTADYAIVGTISDGFGTVQAIEALGVPGSDGPPSRPVVIESATVEQ
jgi:peptidyl-prolyl cis-trans isomerase B (cyclophilin B)